MIMKTNRFLCMLMLGALLCTAVSCGNRSDIEEAVDDKNEQLEKDDSTLVVDDDYFYVYLLMKFDKNHNNVIDKDELDDIVEINVTDMQIKSLKGIERMANLERLYCSNNSLTEVDLSHNIKLKDFYAANNRLSTIDVTALPDLERLDCKGNVLKGTVDVTQNPKLRLLNLSMNLPYGLDNVGLTALDVSKNPELEELDIYYTCINKLDVTHNPKLKNLNIGLNCYTISNRTPIQSIDLSNCPELEVLYAEGTQVDNAIKTLDVTHNPKLRELTTAGQKGLTVLDVSHNPELTLLNCAHNSLSELDLSHNTKLQVLHCPSNQLTKISMKQCAVLYQVDCSHNQLVSLDISGTDMRTLIASDNQLQTLELGTRIYGEGKSAGSGKENYFYLNLNDNQLEILDLAAQKYINWLEVKNNRLQGTLDVSTAAQLGGMVISGNASLTKLKLDPTATRMWEIYAENCNLTGDLDLKRFKLSKAWLDGNPKLKDIYMYEDFKVGNTFFLADHTTGVTGTFPCYKKDDTANWIH